MIRVEKLQLTFPGFTLGPVSLHVRQGAFFALMGPTGSGKTLLLESLAGLTIPHAGRILLADEDKTKAPPEKRRIGLVYQDHALFPHMNVLRNITYGQKYHRIDQTDGVRYARELMERLGLSHLEARKTANLSGGEKQRIALARALACRPDIVLLDEPLSSLDPQFREDVRANLKELHQETGVTFFMVTHDFVDALTLADRAAVIRKGRIEQCAPTLDIFHRPATTFIADFVGMKNIFSSEYGSGRCRFAHLETPACGNAPDSGTGFVALRPEDIAVSLNGDHPENWVSFAATVTTVSRLGFVWQLAAVREEVRFTAQLDHRLALSEAVQKGSTVTLSFDPQLAHHIVS